jgi:spore maturation protein CgeB
MKIVILGLSITSSWGNGHATTYRALVREFASRGHDVVFLERDLPWYRDNRDLRNFPFADVHCYDSLAELKRKFGPVVRSADAVIVGSYVPDGVAVGEWVIGTAGGVTGFYDIDTPVTLAKLQRGDCEYLSPTLIHRYHLYLSFTGGPTLRRLEQEFGSPCARALYCSVDPELYRPLDLPEKWELGYLGTYSPDRQPGLDELLVRPAALRPSRRFIVAGPQYPKDIAWPANVARIEHLPPAHHGEFYNSQRFTLNITRADMKAAGWSPSVRLFEAAACGTPIISDYWPGLNELFASGTEVLIAQSAAEVEGFLRALSPERAAAIGAAARQRVLRSHTAAHRAAELESHLEALITPDRAVAVPA